MDSKSRAHHELGTFKRDRLQQKLEQLTSSMEDGVCISVTPTKSDVFFPDNEEWIGGPSSERVDSAMDETLFFSMEELRSRGIRLSQDNSENEPLPNQDLVLIEEAIDLSSLEGTLVQKIQTTERQEGLIDNAQDGDKVVYGQVKDAATQAPDIAQRESETSLPIGIEPKRTTVKTVRVPSSVSSQGVDPSSSERAEKNAIEDAVIAPKNVPTDERLKRMEEGFLLQSDVLSLYQSCESLIPNTPVEDRSRVSDPSPIPSCSDSLWREMNQALQTVDVTLQRACLQTAFNVVTAFLKNNCESPRRAEAAIPSLSPGQVIPPPAPAMVMSEPLQDSPVQPRVEVHPRRSVTVAQVLDQQRRQQQQQRLRHTSPVEKVPNYFRCTESFRRKLTTPLATSYRKVGDLPPLRQTPKRNVEKQKSKSRRDHPEMVVEAKSIPKTEVRSIRGGVVRARAIPPPEVKSDDWNQKKVPPLVKSEANPPPQQRSRGRVSVAGRFPPPVHRAGSKRRESKPRTNPHKD